MLRVAPLGHPRPHLLCMSDLLRPTGRALAMQLAKIGQQWQRRAAERMPTATGDIREIVGQVGAGLLVFAAATRCCWGGLAAVAVAGACRLLLCGGCCLFSWHSSCSVCSNVHCVRLLLLPYPTCALLVKLPPACSSPAASCPRHPRRAHPPSLALPQPVFVPLFKLYRIYGKVFKLSFGPKQFVIVSDPDMAKHVSPLLCHVWTDICLVQFVMCARSSPSVSPERRHGEGTSYCSCRRYCRCCCCCCDSLLLLRCFICAPNLVMLHNRLLRSPGNDPHCPTCPPALLPTCRSCCTTPPTTPRAC